MNKRKATKAKENPKLQRVKAGKKRITRRPAEVKARILAAALDLFATYGFDGTSTHRIAAAAHVSLSLLLYHYKSKDALWKAMIKELAAKHTISQLIDELDATKLSVTEKLKRVIEALVRQFADVPAIHRLMTLEGHQPSKRLLWLCETFVASDFRRLCDLLIEGQKQGLVRKVSPARLRYAIFAVAAVPFSVSAEYQYLTNRNPFSSSEIEQAIEFINRIVFVLQP